MKRFGKRTYRNPLLFLADMAFIVMRAPALLRVMGGKGLDPKFRERLMLAVTRVNRCRYCAYAHTKAALSEGMAPGEIDAILASDFGAVPEGERTAILYAQHWAETEGHTDPEARSRLESEYGAQTARLIHLPLRLVRIGNYLGNFADLIAFTLTLGRAGGSWRYDKR